MTIELYQQRLAAPFLPQEWNGIANTVGTYRYLHPYLQQVVKEVAIKYLGVVERNIAPNESWLPNPQIPLQEPPIPTCLPRQFLEPVDFLDRVIGSWGKKNLDPTSYLYILRSSDQKTGIEQDIAFIPCDLKDRLLFPANIPPRLSTPGCAVVVMNAVDSAAREFCERYPLEATRNLVPEVSGFYLRGLYEELRQVQARLNN